MTDDQFDDELRQLVEKYRRKDKTFDWTTTAQARSYLKQPEPSQDVVQRGKQDLPVVLVPTEEEQFQRRLEAYKNAVSFGLFSEWPTCKHQEGVERLRLAAWNDAASVKHFMETTEKVKWATLDRLLPE